MSRPYARFAELLKEGMAVCDDFRLEADFAPSDRAGCIARD